VIFFVLESFVHRGRIIEPAAVCDDKGRIELALLDHAHELRGRAQGCAGYKQRFRFEFKEEIGLLMTDQRMPEMMGLDFLVQCKKVRPLSSRILVTAVLSLPTIVDSIITRNSFLLTPHHLFVISSCILRLHLTSCARVGRTRHISSLMSPPCPSVSRPLEVS